MKKRIIEISDFTPNIKKITLGTINKLDLSLHPVKLEIYLNDSTAPFKTVRLMVETAQQPKRTSYDIEIPKETMSVILVLETTSEFDLSQFNYVFQLNWARPKFGSWRSK